ncbi:MAG TPA: dihydroorotate dehydrogenase [Spirochaetota bacterium]|nr:dihydroorotate dehydrogenase [Spirochaetota bacterium]HOL56932.1 dihydroorotate dehydrogenase [Spirochaetota bacterium]HPP04646.1 dihydroorotate dehydrogenase [Spirochaetota bacterium]
MENIKFGKLLFKRNGILASGILGVTGHSLLKVANSGAGGVTSKSISREKRKGHPPPVVQVFEHGVINAVGLSSLGIEESLKELKIVKSNSSAIVIASIFAGSIEEFSETASFITEEYADAIEVNISCPNVSDEFGLPFAASPQMAAKVTLAVRKATKLPLIIKLSPNFPNIGIIAKACEINGADAISAINTVGPGMIIDINTYKPKISNKKGGLSGKCILPIAVRCVYEIYQSVTLPIIGMGGITTYEDAIQIIMAGATLYGVGTGILYEGLEIFDKINNGIKNFLKEKKLSYEELVGISHKT